MPGSNPSLTDWILQISNLGEGDKVSEPEQLEYIFNSNILKGQSEILILNPKYILNSMLKRLTVSVIYNAHLSLFRETTNKNKMPSLHGGHT